VALGNTPEGLFLLVCLVLVGAIYDVARNVQGGSALIVAIFQPLTALLLLAWCLNWHWQRNRRTFDAIRAYYKPWRNGLPIFAASWAAFIAWWMIPFPEASKEPTKKLVCFGVGALVWLVASVLLRIKFRVNRHQ
jgi:hypothetical protein